MSDAVLESFTPAQMRLYRLLISGVHVRHMAGCSYCHLRYPDGRKRFQRKHVQLATFEALLNAKLLRLVDAGSYYQTYAIAEELLKVAEQPIVKEIPSGWVNRSNYRPTPLFAVSPAAWKEWNGQ